MFLVMDERVSSEKCLDSQLWHACAGAMVQMPPMNSKVFYFPQGHAEHAHGKVDFGSTRILPFIPCRVSGMKYMADPDTDEVFVKMRLTPLRDSNDMSFEDDSFLGNHGGGVDGQEKPASFAKTLTQSDANNGGGFSVPRYCAETIFPRLDYSAEPPVQTIIAKDVHGQNWKFRHIYRGTPRRHLLTTGWSNFVNQKRLVAGDSIVFLRAENGDLCVGIRRAKKEIGGGIEYPSGWNSNHHNHHQGVPLFGGNSGFMREDESSLMMRRKCHEEIKGKVTAESVVEAVTCAVNGRPFEVVYYPRASTPEFCVKASSVKAAMQIQWCSGMRFKMPFETEDSSRISWFMGTISSVQVADPIRWPDSPWRLLQVAWDEPDLLQNVKSVNPWLVELVSNMPTFHLSPFSPPRKKSRFMQHPEFPLLNQLPMPTFSGNLLNQTNSPCHVHDSYSPAGIQGARHSQYGLSPCDFPFNKLQSDMLLGKLPRLDHASVQPPRPPPRTAYNSSLKNNAEISCLLTMGNPRPSLKEPVDAKTPHILLFGQRIHAEQQSSISSSASTTGNSLSEGTSRKASNVVSDGSGSSALRRNSPTENSSEGGSSWYKDQHNSDIGTENVNLLCLAL